MRVIQQKTGVRGGAWQCKSCWSCSTHTSPALRNTRRAANCSLVCLLSEPIKLRPGGVRLGSCESCTFASTVLVTTFLFVD
jgi:hypothetical protein